MKQLIALCALALSVVAPAQLVTNSTPDPARSFEWKQTSDGSSLAALTAFTLHEVYVNLPFGMDFYAGHGVWLGTRTRLQSPGEAQGVMGYEWYGLKPIGGDGFFVKGSLGVAIGPRTNDSKSLTGYAALSAGWRF